MLPGITNFTNPEENIKHLELKAGEKAADFGAGSGAYTMTAAAMVGDKGKVYAIDVQKEMLTRLSALAQDKGLSNVEVIWGDLDRLGGSKIVAQSVDAVIMSNILFQSEDKQTIVLEAKRLLKPEGRALIIDWKESFGGLGPASSQVVSAAEGRKIMTEAGFNVVKEFNAGEHHWGLLAVCSAYGGADSALAL